MWSHNALSRLVRGVCRVWFAAAGIRAADGKDLGGYAFSVGPLTGSAEGIVRLAHDAVRNIAYGSLVFLHM